MRFRGRLAPRAVVAAAVLATALFAAPTAYGGGTATCGTNGEFGISGTVCGVDFSATPKTLFSGVVGTYSVDSPASYSGSVIDWGDGSVPSSGSAPGGGSGNITGTHTYTSPADYTTHVTATGCFSTICESATGTGTAHVGRYTGTLLTCTRTRVPLGDTVQCIASVSDTEPSGTASTPTGTIKFAKDGAGSLSDPSCDFTGSPCQVTYTPSAVGSEPDIVSASFTSNDSLHIASADSAAFAVTRRTTQTSLTCAPATITVGKPSTCTATVTDGDSGTPTLPQGTVSFTTPSAGSLGSPSCTLPATGPRSCSVSYTPSATGSGPHTIQASYQGSSLHETSAGASALSVTKRAARTRVACRPSAAIVKTSVNCTATVDDVVGGLKSRPTGKVTFASEGAGSFGPGRSCTLPAGGANSCSVSYRPSAVGLGRHRVTAGYGGDDAHASGTAHGVVRVGRSFTFGSLTLDKTNSTATLVVKLLDPGRLVLSGKGIKHRSANVAAGDTGVLVQATGAAAKQLASKHAVKVTAVVTFTPAVGIRVTKRKPVKLTLG